MSKIKIFELLQQDIKDLKSLLNYENYGITQKELKIQMNAIINNLEDNFQELINLL
ncbi:MAG: hypothetical protein PHE78_01975 [Candidatus Gastranaerophilales bacterium]|nr:hypothetical protein [Candidatus Gastranaerophilales bacterium]